MTESDKGTRAVGRRVPSPPPCLPDYRRGTESTPYHRQAERPEDRQNLDQSAQKRVNPPAADSQKGRPASETALFDLTPSKPYYCRPLGSTDYTGKDATELETLNLSAKKFQGVLGEEVLNPKLGLTQRLPEFRDAKPTCPRSLRPHNRFAQDVKKRTV